MRGGQLLPVAVRFFVKGPESAPQGRLEGAARIAFSDTHYIEGRGGGKKKNIKGFGTSPKLLFLVWFPISK